MSSESQRTYKPEIPSLTSRICTTLSCVIIGCVLVWLLSIPFRMPASSLAGIQPAKSADSVNSAVPSDAAERLKQKKVEAERYRREALVLDEQFMRSLAASNDGQPQQPKPGIEHAREYRRAYKNRLQREIQALGRPKVGSTQWHYQQSLKQKLESNEDAPL